MGYGGQLHFLGGTVLEPGETTSFLSAPVQVANTLAASTGAAAVGYDGSGNWADATSIPGGTVESAIDTVVSDLAAPIGGGKVGFQAAHYLGAGQVNQAIHELELNTVYASVSSPVPIYLPAPFNNKQFSDIAHNAGTTIAVGGALGVNEIRRTTDGINWTKPVPEAPYNNPFRGIAYGAGVWVAVGFEVHSSSDDGATWTQRLVPNEELQRVIYANGKFVAVGDNGDIYASNGGTVWAQQFPDNSYVGQIKDIAYGAGLFVFVGTTDNNDYSPLQTSPDGLVWTEQTVTPQFMELKAITFGNGVFVATDSTEDNGIQTSTDGINWASRTAEELTGVDYDLNKVLYADGIYWVFGETGTVLASTDSITWRNLRRKTFNLNYTSAAYANGIYYTTVNTSSDTVLFKANPALPIDGAADTLAFATGAGRVGFKATQTWQDTSTVDGTNVSDALNEIIADLAEATSPTLNGARRVGFNTTQQWADLTGVGATNTSAAIAEVIADLAQKTSPTNNGAKRVGFATAQLWNGGSAVGADNVGDALTEVIADLQEETSSSLCGARRVGFKTTQNWNGGSTVAATNVGGALTEIIGDLASSAAAFNNGAARIGMAPQSTLTSTSVETALVELAVRAPVRYTASFSITALSVATGAKVSLVLANAGIGGLTVTGGNTVIIPITGKWKGTLNANLRASGTLSSAALGLAFHSSIDSYPTLSNALGIRNTATPGDVVSVSTTCIMSLTATTALAVEAICNSGSLSVEGVYPVHVMTLEYLGV